MYKRDILYCPFREIIFELPPAAVYTKKNIKIIHSSTIWDLYLQCPGTYGVHKAQTGWELTVLVLCLVDEQPLWLLIKVTLVCINVFWGKRLKTFIYRELGWRRKSVCTHSQDFSQTRLLICFSYVCMGSSRRLKGKFHVTMKHWTIQTAVVFLLFSPSM